MEIEENEITEKIEERLTADWVILQMDEEAWRKLSEKERQALIARVSNIFNFIFLNVNQNS